MTREELDKLAEIFGDKLLEGGGVDFTDFVGTGITLENIHNVALHFNEQMQECAEDRGEEWDGLKVSFYAPVQ